MKTNNTLHGYFAIPRHARLLIQELGYDLFGFYIGLVFEAEWRRYSPNFSCVMMTQVELSKRLHVNQSTVSRCLKKLESHKQLIIRHSNDIKLGYFPLFLTDVVIKIESNDYADLNALYADMHRINAYLQEKNANLHNNRAQKVDNSYIPSNDNYSFGKEFNLNEINENGIKDDDENE